ncbi:glutathione binding-like protein, partial [Porticoccaceae bacterium]|nr:glutathione binding-like protein [Porticoccaceae bacterium]
DAELAEHKWIGSDSMSLADIAFAPYATRLEHLHLSAMWHHKPHFKDWYERLKRTEGYQQGLAGWFNPKYLELMDRAGAEAWPNIFAMLD